MMASSLLHIKNYPILSNFFFIEKYQFRGMFFVTRIIPKDFLKAFWFKSLKTYLSRQEWQNLPDDGIESLAYLSLFVHLHIQAIRHLVILQQEHSDAS